MKVNRSIIAAILVLIMGTTACNLPSGQETGQGTPNPYEAAAMTVTVIAATEQAGTPKPTNTSVPTFAPPSPASTNTTAPPQPTGVQVTATPSGTFFAVDVGANCRTGPGTQYDKIASFAQGTFLQLIGRHTDNNWWYIQTGSTKCWISASTGHTTGSTDSVPVAAAPPTPTVVGTTPAVTAGPKLSDPVALVAELSYPGTCASNSVSVAIRVTDNGNGINSTWLSYRYVGDGGYTGNWHNVSPNDNASGGVNGFNYPIATEAAAEMGTQNGTFQYQFFAKDNLGNTSSYPVGTPLGMPIKYCQ